VGTGGLRRWQHVVIVALGAAALVGVGANPASAHTVGGVNATNYRTRITAVTTPLPGVTVRVVDDGNQLELRNVGRHDVVVVGYDHEPYLRVGPRGTYENLNSPATYLDRVLSNPAPPPSRADPTASPDWHQVSGADTVRWHDHRAHWMGSLDPPVVARDPGHAHLIQRFVLSLRSGSRTSRVHGDVWWIPGPSPWPWIAVALAGAVTVVLAARTRRAVVVIATGLAIAVLATTLHALGAWNAGTTSTAGRLSDVAPTLGAVALGVGALVRLRRRGLRAAAPVLVFAGLFVAIAIGIADLPALSRSQVPTTLPVDLDRLMIALALGLGAGVAGGAAQHVSDRRSMSTQESGRSASPPPPG